MKWRRKLKKSAPASANWTGARRRAQSKIGTLASVHSIPGLNGNARLSLSTGSNGKGPHKVRNAASEIKKWMRVREQWLREEIRANRIMILELMKWGVVVLSGVTSSLYFVRRDVAKHLAALGALPSYGTVPPGRWFIGTLFLTMIASIFSVLTTYVMKRHVGYRTQLLKRRLSYSRIQERETGGRIKYLHYFLFFAFPAFDLVLWFYFRATGSITIPW